jgi:pimeloyl-ACP methyl ester carboxylesterase
MLKIISTVSKAAAMLLVFAACNQSSKKTIVETSDKDTVELCVGDYQTPEQAKEQLARFAASYSNVEEWERRAETVRQGFIRGAELDKIPASYRDAPFEQITGATHKMNGYTITNIAIIGMPGHYIAGNLYKPEKIKGKAPIILSPHGHAMTPDDYGRFRTSEQVRCGMFARMGAVVFAYDMIGFGESTDYKHTDPKALKIQTFNSMRVLDYLCSLDFTDSAKVGVTGSSGGGTQTLYLSVVDPRVTVMIPVVMTSSYFFGGCSCESGMPVHKSKTHETNNVDLAALFAPKPALFISDGHDWPANFPHIGFPYIRNVYKLYGAEKKVENVHLPDEFHDYGPSKREAAYKFFARYLRLDYNAILDKNKKADESKIKLLNINDMKVFPGKPIVFMKGWSYEWSDVFVEEMRVWKEKNAMAR